MLGYASDADPWAAAELGADSYEEFGQCYNIDENDFWDRTFCLARWAALTGAGGAIFVGGMAAHYAAPTATVPQAYAAAIVTAAAVGFVSAVVMQYADSVCQGSINPVGG